jgi:uncharacterized damage-inducible protein DinB
LYQIQNLMMYTQSLLNDVAAFNSWANETLVAWAASHSIETLTEDLPNDQGSILKLLNHIWAVEEFWMNVVQGKNAFASQRYSATEFQLKEIAPGLVAQSQAFQAYVASLSAADYSEVISFDFPWVKGEQPRLQLLQHVFNHSAYHRGQVTSMARRLGWTGAPLTDYIFFKLATPALQP